MFVKPKDGVSVRNPVKGSPLPQSGAEVPDNTFWRRRLSDGDVSIVKQAAAGTSTEKAAKKTEGAE
ncbi:DUF2635 domain-containing protein [Cedecea neteri]|uniref:DUF2635 domain-containing protein n=1 Tax=Cedecea neteri TaxID=158822 RepID=UPI002AA957D5|nr:DUF2635 domain-containing protein [Cedecea neteri]WPU24999.1 DUF2635 domain-containing protein [Cedecea neteri]